MNDAPDQILRDFHKALSQIDDSVSLDNIFRDITAFTNRIKTGEYSNTDFIDRQTFDTPRRVYEFFNYLIGYQQSSETWKVLLSAIDLNQVKTIMDWCSGSSPRIELALRDLQYSHDLFIVDKNPASQKQIKNLVDLLGVSYQLHFISNDIYAMKPGFRSDLIVGNHIIDDLLLNEYCEELGLDQKDLYGNEALFRAATTCVQKQVSISSFCTKLAETIDLHLSDNGIVVLTHYLGVTERALELFSWSDWVSGVLIDLANELMQMGYQAIPAIHLKMDGTVLLLKSPSGSRL